MIRILLLALALLPLAAHADDTIRLKVLTFNIWYGGDQVSLASVIKAIELADADVVGLQEPDGKTLEIAALAGYPFADQRRHILSKYPIFDSGLGETTQTLGSSFKCNTQRPWGIGCCDGQTIQAPWQRGTWRDFGRGSAGQQSS